MEFDPSKLAQMMTQAQQMHQQMLDDLARSEVEGAAGGGMVTVRMNGNFQVTSVKIDPTVVDPSDLTMLEDLVQASVNDASRRVEELRNDKARAVAGGLGLPPGML